MNQGRIVQQGAAPNAARVAGDVRCIARLLGLLCLWSLSSLVSAAPPGTNLDCTVSATPVAFGVYDPVGGAPLDGVGQITVDCRPSEVAFTVSMSAGATGTYAARRMTSGSNVLEYNLYLDSSRTVVFGDGTGGSSNATCITGVTANGCVGSNPAGGGRRAVMPFYGRIPADQNAAAGTYADVVYVEIVF